LESIKRFIRNPEAMAISELCIYMPSCGEAGVIQVWQPGNRRWVEFRGPPYSQWGDTPNDMQQVHDALEGWHATVLHQGEVLLIHDKHPDFMRILALFERNSSETAGDRPDP
jgi:hypothetical protein